MSTVAQVIEALMELPLDAEVSILRSHYNGSEDVTEEYNLAVVADSKYHNPIFMADIDAERYVSEANKYSSHFPLSFISVTRIV